MKKVLILGGGYGGLTALHRLMERGKGYVDVTLISRGETVQENTSNPMVLAGDLRPEDTIFSLRSLAESLGFNFEEGEVKELGLEKQEVKTERGTFNYDYLIIATGGSYQESFNSLPWHHEAYMHHFLEGFLSLRKRLEEAQDDTTVLVGNMEGNPTEGPSYQTAMVTDLLLRRRGVKHKTILTTLSPKGPFGALPDSRPSTLVNRAMKERRIEILPGKAVRDYHSGKAIMNDGSEIEADVVSVLPPLRASKFIEEAGLTDGKPFARVEFPTYRSFKAKNVFVVGDAAEGPIPPKTARGAMIGAENAVSTILKEVKGSIPVYYAQGVICMMYGGDYGGMLRFEPSLKKVTYLEGDIFMKLKMIYDRMLVDTRFGLKYHAAPPITT